MDLEAICYASGSFFLGQVQNDLKTLGSRFLGRDLHFLEKCQKWVWKWVWKWSVGTLRNWVWEWSVGTLRSGLLALRESANRFIRDDHLLALVS